jgi:hypothetical protein
MNTIKKDDEDATQEQDMSNLFYKNYIRTYNYLNYVLIIESSQKKKFLIFGMNVAF